MYVCNFPVNSNYSRGSNNWASQVSIKIQGNYIQCVEVPKTHLVTHHHGSRFTAHMGGDCVSCFAYIFEHLRSMAERI